MGITLRTKFNDFQATIKAEAYRVEAEYTRAFARLGEECVRRVRDREEIKSWFDQTGNLRSSVGYIIVRNGVIVGSSEFPIVKNGGEGQTEGREYAESLARNYANKQLALIVVAGMNYADYVEAKDNKDVLASTEDWVKLEAPKIEDKLLERLKR